MFIIKGYLIVNSFIWHNFNFKLINITSFMNTTNFNKFNKHKYMSIINIKRFINTNFINKIFISKFSTTFYKFADNSYRANRRRDDYFREHTEKLIGLEKEKQALEQDLALINPAIGAAYKLSRGKLPETEEHSVLLNLKENYPAFFDSEGEEEGAKSTLNKIMGVKSYLKKELKINKRATNRLQEEGDRVAFDEISVPHLAQRGEAWATPRIERGESSSRPQIERGESSSRSYNIIETEESSSRSQIEGGKSSKRKIDYSDSEDSTTSSSKKNRQSPSDYIDSLPELPYNPIDDWD